MGEHKGQTVEETINKMKSQPSEWEKVFTSEATEKKTISKIYKQLMKLNTKKKKNISRRPK